MSELIGQSYILNGEVISVNDVMTFNKLSNQNNSVYEVIRVEEGVPLFFEDYMQRLENSFNLLKISLFVSHEIIKETIHQLIEINNFRSGPVKLIFGLGEPGFFVAFLMKPHLPKAEEYRYGVKTVLLLQDRNNPNIKIWNNELRQKSVALLVETGAYEAILVNRHGIITEASRSNIFFTKGNVIYTTEASQVLPGITRKKVLEVCSLLKLDVQFKSIKVDELENYNSCFLTGTARKIVPIRMIEDASFDAENPLVQKISLEFEKLVTQYISQNKV